MKRKKISEFVNNEKVDQHFLIKRAELRTATNGKTYLDIAAGDKWGEIICRKWDSTVREMESISEGKIYRIKGKTNEYKGLMQIIIDSFEPVENIEKIDMNDFIESAPEDPLEMFQEIKNYINKINNRDIKRIVIEIYSKYKEGLMYYPAAQKNHHSFKSGLLYHTQRMLHAAEKLSLVYEGINTDLLYAGVLLHDICKIDEMDSNEMGIVNDYTRDGKMLGHIIMGIKEIDKAAEKLNADEEISMMLQHMILSHHYYPEFGSPRKPMFLEAELLHYLDILDARIFDFQNAVKDLDPGNFSEKVWVLDNRQVYKPGFEKE